MKYKEIKKNKDEELKKILETLRKEEREYRFGVSGSKVKDVKASQKRKRDIARVLTEMRNRK